MESDGWRLKVLLLWVLAGLAVAGPVSDWISVSHVSIRTCFIRCSCVRAAVAVSNTTWSHTNNANSKHIQGVQKTIGTLIFLACRYCWMKAPAIWKHLNRNICVDVQGHRDPLHHQPGACLGLYYNYRRDKRRWQEWKGRVHSYNYNYNVGVEWIVVHSYWSRLQSFCHLHLKGPIVAWPSVCFDPLLAAGQLAACRHGWRSQTQLGSGAGAAAVSCREHNLIHLPIREIFKIELSTKLRGKFSQYSEKATTTAFSLL